MHYIINSKWRRKQHKYVTNQRNVKNLAESAYEIGNRALKNMLRSSLRTQLAKDVLEIIRHLINMNDIFFLIFSQKKLSFA